MKEPSELLDPKSDLESVQRKLELTERALESQTKLLSLIPDPIEVVSPDYTVLFANRASRLLHENEQLEGTLYYESVMGLPEAPDECPIRRAIDDDREAAYTAESDEGDVFEVAVTPFVLSDGRRAAMCYTKMTMKEDSGAVAVVEDEDKDILEKIAHMSARTLDAVLDQVTDGVLMIDKGGKPVLYNEAFRTLTGVEETDKMAPEAVDALPGILFPDRAPDTSPLATLNALTEGGTTQRFETEILPGDGERIPVELAVSPIPGDKEPDTVLLVTIRDLREERETKDKLIKALNLSLAGGRIASLAHRINKFLGPAFYHADRLAQRDHVDRKTRDSVTTIQNYLHMCHESIAMVLSLVRPTAPGAVNMNHLISDVFSEHYLADELRLDNVEVVQRYDPGMVETMGYPVLLQQALANIIKNAQEAMVRANGGGRLMVRTEASPSTITIQVTDDGPGIPHDIQDKIFDLLYTSSASSEGRGVGLYLAREVIARHDGTIKVISHSGEGATFEISLPVRQPKPAAAIAEGEAPGGVPEPDREKDTADIQATGRILIIDDEPGIADLLSDILEKSGHTVTTSLDANDALKKIRSNVYDCIVCDIRMPGIEGRELAGKVKEHDEEQYNRLVFISGDISEPETEAFLNESGIPVIEQPFTTERVHEVVQEVLSPRGGTPEAVEAEATIEDEAHQESPGKTPSAP